MPLVGDEVAHANFEVIWHKIARDRCNGRLSCSVEKIMILKK